MKKLLFLIVLILIGYAVWRWYHRGQADASRGQELFYDRAWLDRVPRTDRDSVQVFVALTKRPFGAFQTGTAWRGSWEVFRHERRADGELAVTYPQTGEREQLTYRAVRCDDRGADFCLELSGASRGTRRYISKRGWEVHSLEDAQHLAQLPAAE